MRAECKRSGATPSPPGSMERGRPFVVFDHFGVDDGRVVLLRPLRARRRTRSVLSETGPEAGHAGAEARPETGTARATPEGCEERPRAPRPRPEIDLQPAPRLGTQC